jgi:hypothetical protein
VADRKQNKQSIAAALLAATVHISPPLRVRGLYDAESDDIVQVMRSVQVVETIPLTAFHGIDDIVAVLSPGDERAPEPAVAASFDTLTPTVLAGKGFGDLPDRLAVLRPLAVAGLLGVQIPTGRHPHVVVWGGVIEYSLPYLEFFVKRVNLSPPLNRLVPLVEIEMRTNLDRDSPGRLRGTVNPGFVWVGDVLQIGLEAVAPLDDRSGRGVGVRGFLRVPLDALLGERFGRPLFGSP